MEVQHVRRSHVPDTEVRCKSCGTLLAKTEAAGLTIRRGDLQATIDGAFRATLVCYRPRCRTLNIVEHAPPIRRAPAVD